MGYEKNTRILIATFSDYSTACQAARALNEHGVPQDAVYIDSNQKTAGAGSGGYDQQNGGQFSEWWSSRFGSDREQSARQEYEGALASGRTVVRCIVDESLTDASTDILNQHGAAEIETRSEAPATATLSGSSSPARRGGVRVYTHDNLYPAEPRHASTMHSTSFKRGSDSVMSGFGMSPGEGTLAGPATAGSAIQDYSFQDLTNQEEISDFKRHFEQNYSGRSDFGSLLPAYNYGYTSASDERFRKMSWDEAEPELRSGYREGATCPWGEARAAVRYAYERRNQ
jgi:hypothetical protein